MRYAEFLGDRMRIEDRSLGALSRAAALEVFGIDVDEIQRADTWSRAEIDRVVCAAELKFNARRETSGLGSSMQRPGRLIPVNRGFRILVRKDLRATTFRYVVAHELVHTLSYDCSKPRPVRLLPNSKEEERLCDLAARKILVPRSDSSVFGLALAAWDPRGLGGLPGTAARLGVTPWAVLVRALEELDRLPAIAVLWRLETGSVARVVDLVAPLGLYVPRRKRSPREGGRNLGVWHSVASGGVWSGTDLLDLGSVRDEHEAIVLSAKEPWPSAIQIIRLDESLSGQLLEWTRRNHLRMGIRQQSTVAAPESRLGES